MDKNKELCELLGICWHELWTQEIDNLSDWGLCKLCRKPASECDNPDFTKPEGIIQLLGIMKKRNRFNSFHRFIAKINQLSLDEDGDFIDNAIPVNYLLDTTGKLRDAAIEFLKSRVKEGA